MRKIFISLALVFAVMLGTPAAAVAGNVRVAAGGVIVQFERPTVAAEGHFLVCINELAGAIGAEVHVTAGAAVATLGDKRVSIIDGASFMRVNDEIIPLDMPPMMVEGFWLYPFEIIVQALGVDISWNDSARVVYIGTEPDWDEIGPPPRPPQAVLQGPSRDMLPDMVVNPWRASYPSPFTNGILSDQRQSWSFRRNRTFQPPEAFMRYDIRPFGGHYIGDSTQPVLFLTFDNGYERGFTPTILDVLKDREVTAAFFVTRAFVRSSPHLLIRMFEEGHIVGSHSSRHGDFSQMTDEQILNDLTELEQMVYDITGRNLDPFFRFPYGAYSMRALSAVYEFGYYSFFWSLAFVDWEVHNQPGKESAFRSVVNHVHNGCVILLHAISESNTEALPYVLDHLHYMGFTFGSLWDIVR